MLANKRKRYGAPAGGLLLAGLAAFAYYKYSKLSSQEKQDLVSNLKEKGRQLFGQLKGNMQNAYQDNKFEQGSGYTS